VEGGVYRTDRFARCPITLLAEERDKAGADMRVATFPVPFDVNPVNGSATNSFLLGAKWNVVLGVAGHNTGFAAITFIQVDDHRPFVVGKGHH
jgi:hypothetical protein